jgi:hypothetical protein
MEERWGEMVGGLFLLIGVLEWKGRQRRCEADGGIHGGSCGFKQRRGKAGGWGKARQVGPGWQWEKERGKGNRPRGMFMGRKKNGPRVRKKKEKGKGKGDGLRGRVGPRGPKQGKEEKVGREKRKRNWAALKAGKEGFGFGVFFQNLFQTLFKFF